jgi:hypothetical protein
MIAFVLFVRWTKPPTLVMADGFDVGWKSPPGWTRTLEVHRVRVMEN